MNLNKPFIHVGDIQQIETIQQIEVVQQIGKTHSDIVEYMMSLPEYNYFKGDCSDIFLYDSNYTKFVGRDFEIQELKNFINDDRKYVWWAIVGTEGSGRHRLAYECQTMLTEDWISRIVPWNICYEYFKQVPYYSMQISSNLLIIIDYFEGEEKTLSKWLMELNYASYDKKLRVLLISHNNIGNIWYKWEERFYQASKQQFDSLSRAKYAERNLDIGDGFIDSNEAIELLNAFFGNYEKEPDKVIQAVQIYSESQVLNDGRISPGVLTSLIQEYVRQDTTEALGIINKSIFLRQAYINVTEAERIIGITSDEIELFEDIVLCISIIGKIEIENVIQVVAAIFRKNADYYSNIKQKIKTTSLCQKEKNNYYFEIFSHRILSESYVFQRLEKDNDLSEICFVLFEHYPLEVYRMMESFVCDFEKELREISIYEKLCEICDGFIGILDDSELKIWDSIDDRFLGYEALFTFSSSELNSEYIVYTDNSVDCDGNIKIEFARYREVADIIFLKYPNSENENELFERIVNELSES